MLVKKIEIMKVKCLLINKQVKYINNLKNMLKLYYVLKNNYNWLGILRIWKEK